MVVLHKRKLSSAEKQNGVVYTPSNLSAFVAEKVVNFWFEENHGTSNLKIIDPACGGGELLTAAWKALSEKVLVPQSNPSEVLCGLDIDEIAVAKSIASVRGLDRRATAFNILKANALFPDNSRFGVNDWPSLQSFFKAENGFDILIANPPWGADVSAYKEKLIGSNYTLHKGQFDTSDLFVELSLSIVKDGGYFAFIIPDSLFGHERKDLRRLLAEQTEIKYVARLGEKIFEGVNRACVVLIGRKTRPTGNSRVSCVRLNPLLRRQILNGETTFTQADKSLSHTVRQSRFSQTTDFLFDIDTKEAEMEVLNKITQTNSVIGDFVGSSRGVELSKTGKVCRCKACGFWTPLPTNEQPKCPHCKAMINLDEVEITSIISKKRFKGSKPLLVGESVQRYSISARYWISLNNKGINYKKISMYYEPKILVRKTGVGITATIDYSNAMTNQVVYMFRPREDKKHVSIEFILAAMNSRALYYYLLKKYGETEWRSHPYLTQSQILSLPLPRPNEQIQQKISKLLKPYLEKHEAVPNAVDASVEHLLAKLFGLTKADYEVIYKTIEDTQGLIPVKKLTSVGVADIFKVQR